MKKISIYNLLYFTIIIIIFTIQYNRDVFDFFHKEWNVFSVWNKQFFSNNSFVWIWLPANIFIAFFIILTTFIKLQKMKKALLFYIAVTLSITLCGIFLPYMYACLLDWANWTIFFILFILILLGIIFAVFHKKFTLYFLKIKNYD